MTGLDQMLVHADATLAQDDYARAYRQLRVAYPLALQQLAAVDSPDELVLARRVLLRCQDGLARCHEARGEIGPAAHAAHAALQLATVLEEPDAELSWRAIYLDTLIDRLESN